MDDRSTTNERASTCRDREIDPEASHSVVPATCGPRDFDGTGYSDQLESGRTRGD